MNERTPKAARAAELPDEGLRPLALNLEWRDANARRDELKAELERIDAEAAKLRAIRSKGRGESAAARAMALLRGEEVATASDAERQALDERRAIIEQGLREAEGELVRLHRELSDAAAQGLRPKVLAALDGLAAALRSVVEAKAAFDAIGDRLRDAGYCPEQVSLPLAAADLPSRDAGRMLRIVERIKAELVDSLMPPDEAAQPVPVRVLSDVVLQGHAVGARTRLPLRQARQLARIGAVELMGA